jgi:glutathione S-transferase
VSIILYDLAGAEPDRRFCPFCWRTRMALAHKGLEIETVPRRFTEKDKLPQPNGGRVPVVVDGGQVVHDSSAIADYLETRYAERSSLFGGERGRALTRFVQNWTETVFGAFQWARAISDFELLAADDPVAAWRGRVLDPFSGFARTSSAYGG